MGGLRCGQGGGLKCGAEDVCLGSGFGDHALWARSSDLPAQMAGSKGVLAQFALDLLVGCLRGTPNPFCIAGNTRLGEIPFSIARCLRWGLARKSSFLTFRMDLAYTSPGKTPVGRKAVELPRCRNRFLGNGII